MFLHDEPIFRLHSTALIVTVIYKITKIVRALRLAERSVCMRVCKHGCGVKLFGFSRAKFEKVFDFKSILDFLRSDLVRNSAISFSDSC